MKRRLTGDARGDISAFSNAAATSSASPRSNAIKKADQARARDDNRLSIADRAKVASDETPTTLIYHLRYCRHGPDGQSVAEPRHLIVYRIVDQELIIVLRVLHDAMDLPAHLCDD